MRKGCADFVCPFVEFLMLFLRRIRRDRVEDCPRVRAFVCQDRLIGRSARVPEGRPPGGGGDPAEVVRGIEGGLYNERP